MPTPAEIRAELERRKRAASASVQSPPASAAHNAQAGYYGATSSADAIRAELARRKAAAPAPMPQPDVAPWGDGQAFDDLYARRPQKDPLLSPLRPEARTLTAGQSTRMKPPPAPRGPVMSPAQRRATQEERDAAVAKRTEQANRWKNDSTFGTPVDEMGMPIAVTDAQRDSDMYEVRDDVGKGIVASPIHAERALVGAAEATLNTPGDYGRLLVPAFAAGFDPTMQGIIAGSEFGVGADTLLERFAAASEAGGYQDMLNKLQAAPRFDFSAAKIPVPKEIESVSGALAEGLAQFLISRKLVGKVLPGGGLAAHTGKDAAAVFVGIDGSTGRLADIIPADKIPEGPLRDYFNFLKTQPDDSPLMGRFKNFLEDLTVSGPMIVPQTVVAPTARAVGNAINPALTPTNAGGARPGAVNTAAVQPPPTTAVPTFTRPQTPPPPVQPQAAQRAPTQPQVATAPPVPPTPPSAPAATVAPPQPVPATGAAPPAGQRTPVPRLGPAEQAYNNLPMKTRESTLNAFQSAGIEANRAKAMISELNNLPDGQNTMYALEIMRRNGLTDADIDGVLIAMGREFATESPRPAGRVFNREQDSARQIMNDQVRTQINSEGRSITDVAERNFGQGVVPAGEALDLELDQLSNAYETILSTKRSPTGRLRSPAKKDAVYKAREDLTNALVSPEVMQTIPPDVKLQIMMQASEDMRRLKFTPDELGLILQGDGKVLAPLFNGYGALSWSPDLWAHLARQYPTQAAHSLQSALRKAADEAFRRGDATWGRYYQRLRGESGKGGLLDTLERAIPKYRETRLKFGDASSAKEALDILERFKAAAASEGDVAKIIKDLEVLPQRHREMAEQQITSIVRQELARKVESPRLAELGQSVAQTPNLTSLSRQDFLKALEDVFGTRGKELADAIRAARARTDTLTSISPKYNSRTTVNDRDVQNAPALYEAPGSLEGGIIDAGVKRLGTVAGGASLIPGGQGAALALGAATAVQAAMNAARRGQRLSNAERNALVDFLFRSRTADDAAPAMATRGPSMGDYAQAIGRDAAIGAGVGAFADGDPLNNDPMALVGGGLGGAVGYGRARVRNARSLIKPPPAPRGAGRRNPPPAPRTPPGAPPVQSGFGGGRKSLKNSSAPASSLRISTRTPTVVSPREDALTQDLVVNIESMKARPESFSHNMELVKEYPGFRTRARNPDTVASEFKDHVKDNLKWLWERTPPAERERTRQWYVGANRIASEISTKSGYPVEAIAAVIAATSPQKNWYQNVSLAERIVESMTKAKSSKWSPVMDETAARIFGKPQYEKFLENIKGKSLSQLKDPTEKAMWIRIHDEAHNDRRFHIISPEGERIGDPSGVAAWGSLVEIAKAVTVLDNPGRNVISESLGSRHKVRNFYNNIIDPSSATDVTIDTHAVAAALLRPLSGNSVEVAHNFGNNLAKDMQPSNWRAAKAVAESGASGTYGIYADAYREAAKELGILPRELQSVTWEAVRNLFQPKWKGNASNVASINDIWKQYTHGSSSLEEVRAAIVERAGGFDDAAWANDVGQRSSGRVDEAARRSADAQELSGLGVSRQPSQRVDGRAGSRASAVPAAPPSGRRKAGLSQPTTSVPQVRRPKPPPQTMSFSSKLLAGTGANATGLSGLGGAAAGYIANPVDANGDGVINDDDRGLNAMGGLVSGLVGGAGANRLLGPRRGATPKAGPQKPPAQSGFGGGSKKTTPLDSSSGGGQSGTMLSDELRQVKKRRASARQRILQIFEDFGEKAGSLDELKEADIRMLHRRADYLRYSEAVSEKDYQRLYNEILNLDDTERMINDILATRRHEQKMQAALRGEGADDLAALTRRASGAEPLQEGVTDLAASQIRRSANSKPKAGPQKPPAQSGFGGGKPPPSNALDQDGGAGQGRGMGLSNEQKKIIIGALRPDGSSLYSNANPKKLVNSLIVSGKLPEATRFEAVNFVTDTRTKNADRWRAKPRRGSDPLEIASGNRDWRLEEYKKQLAANAALDAPIASAWREDFRKRFKAASSVGSKYAEAEARRATVEAIVRNARKRGYSVRHVSSGRDGRNTSQYIVIPPERGGGQIRVSDHELPETDARFFAAMEGRGPRWKADIVVDDWRQSSLDDYLRRIEESMDPPSPSKASPAPAIKSGGGSLPPTTSVPVTRKPPVQSGFGGGPTKGPPRPLMSGKVISELERAKKTLPSQVRSQIAANAAKPSTLRVSAAEATGDDPSLYTLAAPFQRTRKGLPGRKPKPNAIETGVRDTMARIDASVGKPPPLDEAGEAMRLSERQRRAAKSAAQTTANKLNPYVNEAAGIPDKPLPKSVAAREQEATELAITARKLLEKHRLTANEYEQAVAQANARKVEIADALVTGRIAPPNQKGLLPGSAGQTVPPRPMKPVSRRDADEMAELLFNRENAELLDAVLSGRVTPRNRDRYHAALLFAAGGTAGAAGIAAVLADIEAAAQRRRDEVAAKKPKPVYDDPGDPRFVWDWDKIKSTRNKHMEDIQIKLNELPPNASGGKFNLKPDGIWRENGPTDRAIRKWLYDNGFDPNGDFTMEHWDILTKQFQEAQQKRDSTRAAPYRGSLGEMTTP